MDARPMRFAWIALLGLSLLVPVVVSAQPYEVPATWGGDLWSRPRLTGSWFFYNAAVTAWLGTTVDLQIVNPALKKAVSSREVTRAIARDERQSRTIPRKDWRSARWERSLKVASASFAF